MLDTTSAPTAIPKLVAWLHEKGFELGAERSSDRGNQYAVYFKQDQLVKITASRGEWSLGIGMRGQTFHPEQWEAWLDGYPLNDELAGLDRQVDFITQRWDVAAGQARERAGADAEIAKIGDDWVQRRFGFRPPEQISNGTRRSDAE